MKKEIRLFLTEEDITQLKLKASEHGMSVSKYVAKMCNLAETESERLDVFFRNNELEPYAVTGEENFEKISRQKIIELIDTFGVERG